MPPEEALRRTGATTAPPMRRRPRHGEGRRHPPPRADDILKGGGQPDREPPARLIGRGQGGLAIPPAPGGHSRSGAAGVGVAARTMLSARRNRATDSRQPTHGKDCLHPATAQQ